MSTRHARLVEQAQPAQPLELLAQHLLLRLVLVPDEDPALARSRHASIPSTQPLEHEVRLLGEDLAVLEGAGLGLVGVADRVLRLGLLLRDQLPLRAGREAGAAHAAQPGLLELGDQLAPSRARRRAPRAARGSRARRARTGRSARCTSLRADLRRVAGGGGRASRSGRCTRPRATRCWDRRRSSSRRSSEPCSQQDRSWQQATSAASRRRGEEVRIERDQALDLVERAAPLARERHELLARQPAVLPLDRVQIRDQDGPGKRPARASLAGGCCGSRAAPPARRRT